MAGYIQQKIHPYESQCQHCLDYTETRSFLTACPMPRYVARNSLLSSWFYSRTQRAHTFLPPVLMRSGVRNGSKIIWLVSILTGDCLFPTEQRFQAEFTKPQKEGTVKYKASASSRKVWKA